jgi:hypothetical protein
VSRRRLIAATLIASLPALLLAQSTPRGSAYERRIATAGSGPQRLAIDAQLLGGGAPFRVVQRGDSYFAEDGLKDLRLFTTDGRPVPYLLVHPPRAERTWINGRVLPVAATKKTSGFEVDLTAAHEIDMVRIEGLPVPYLKRLTLEGSGDRAHWTLLVSEGTVFDLPDDKLRQTTVGFAAGDYRYLRATWDDANSGRLPLPPTVVARRAAAVPPPPATTIRALVERRPSEPGRSRYRVKLAAAGLPIVALGLDIGGGHVFRSVLVSESRFSGVEATPVGLGRAMLARVTRDGVTASALRVPIAAPSEPEIDLTIEDGANDPLDVRGVDLELAQLPWIYLEAAGDLIARYGDRSLDRPSYDLEAVRTSIDVRAVRDAKWIGEVSAAAPAPEAATASTPAAGPALDPAAFRHARIITGASDGLVALPLDAHALAHSGGPSLRFADLRILDGQSRQLPYLLERRDEPLAITLAIAPVTTVSAPELKQSGSRSRSVYAVTLPFANLPAGRLVVETTASVFQRTVRIGFERAPDRQRRDASFDVRAAETWRRADDLAAPRPLTLPLDAGPDTDLRLVIDEGDNAPLPITAVRLLLPSYRVRFYAPAGTVTSSTRLVYGRSDLQAPQYDLALLAPRVMGAAATEASLASPSAAAPTAASQFVSPRTFWIVLAAAVLVLLALIVRLISGTDNTAAGG